jgi:inorganic phosphate transporter, PiT family
MTTTCFVCSSTPGFSTTMLLLLIGLSLAFDFLNGFHDAANSIATVVSTGVLRPYQAVIWAAFFNLVAFALFNLNVAATIGKGILFPEFVDAYVIGSALIGAIAWNLITWYFGIPSSSSHALIGGMIGAAMAKAGTAPLVAAGITKTLVFIVISPLLGLLLGASVMIAVSWIFFRRSPYTVDQWFRRLQLLSSALYSIGHGSNDAQKTMGLIWLMLISAGATTREHLPLWVVASCYTVMALGTLFGGWRIVRTMGQRITKLKPVGGFCAEAGGALTLFLATGLGVPVSTTHTITGAIVGVGATQRVSAVRWGVAGNIVVAWVLTLPAAALVAAMTWWLATVMTSR